MIFNGTVQYDKIQADWTELQMMSAKVLWKNSPKHPPRKKPEEMDPSESPLRKIMKILYDFVWAVFFLESWLTCFHLLQFEASQEPFVENQEKHRGEAYKYWIWTRLDWHWLAPPPSLDIFLEANPRAVWIPDGSDWDGINDSPLVSLKYLFMDKML